MKLVYCLAATYNSGGMERIVISKVNYLAELGYNITIITTEQKGKSSFFPIHDRVQTIDLAINYSDDINSFFFKRIIKYILKKRKHKQLLTKYLNALSPDIVISTFGNEASFLYRITGKWKKILEIHFSKYFRIQYERKGIWRLIDIYRSNQDEKLVTHYDKFIVLTNEDKEYWGNLANIKVIPNFIHKIPKVQSNLNEKICIAVGRLTYQKGYDRLIDVWKLVNEKFSDWQLHIYGNGELYDILQKKINDNKLNKVIKIFSPTLQIEEVYKKSSIFLLTSNYEGLPMVLLEAFSYGLPVVSFACKCGPKDLIEDGVNGYLVSNGDIEHFAEKVINLISDKELRQQIGQNAYISIHKYSEANIMNEWIDLFNKITKVQIRS